jgi:hypothetical protein
MGIDLRMEPYAEMFEKEARIIDELCFPDLDKLCDRLGLSWGDFYAVIDNEGRLPHDAALKILAAVESHQVPPELTSDARAALIDKRDKLLILLRYYCDWHEHPDHVATQMQGISKGRAPGMEGLIGRDDYLPDKRPWLMLA